jgi:hypothetical protein
VGLSSGEPLRSLVATGEPAFEISAKGRNEPVVQNLPEVEKNYSPEGQWY